MAAPGYLCPQRAVLPSGRAIKPSIRCIFCHTLIHFILLQPAKMLAKHNLAASWLVKDLYQHDWPMGSNVPNMC